jgi:esterase/lipase superfamily enzyme
MMFRAFFFLLAIAACFTGCGGSLVDYRSPETGTRYYPPPAAFRDASLVLGERMPLAMRKPGVDLVFATTRQAVPATTAGGLSGFSDEPDGALHLGTMTMNIGPTGTTWDDLLDWARLNEQQIPPVRVSVSRLNDFGYAGIGSGATAPAERFLTSLEPHYVHGGRRVLLFVHGYNTTFAEAAATLACMHHHQGRHGAAVLFSWPAGTKALRYLYEQDLARVSTNALARLISLLSGAGKVDRIDIVVNSTGGSMLMRALHQLEETVGREGMAAFKLNNVVLAAPDVDLESFVSSDLDLLTSSTKHSVIYSNREDRALGLSGIWSGGLRLGRIEKLDDHQRTALEAKRDVIELVDITDLPGPKDADGVTRHGAWYANPLVVTDLLLFLLTGQAAEVRGLVHDNDPLGWHLPSDYARTAAANIGRLLQETP